MADTPNFGDLMKQAQEMQTKMQDAQKRIASMEVEGVAGAGLVRIRMNGEHKALKVSIDKSLLGNDDEESKEMLEDLVAAAINGCSDKIEDGAKKVMAEIAGGIQLPEGFELPKSEGE